MSWGGALPVGICDTSMVVLLAWARRVRIGCGSIWALWGSSAMTILVKEHVEKILAYTKIRRRQAHESNRQIQEATLRTALQDAQRAGRAQALPSRGVNAGSIVGQHGIGADRQGERDCCSFAGIEPGKRRVRG